MAKISLCYKDNLYPTIKEIVLDPNEPCPIIMCGFDTDCAGKKINRDNEFTCLLEELKKIYSPKDTKPVK